MIITQVGLMILQQGGKIMEKNEKMAAKSFNIKN
jgi:hypothetical protein